MEPISEVRIPEGWDSETVMIRMTEPAPGRTSYGVQIMDPSTMSRMEIVHGDGPSRLMDMLRPEFMVFMIDSIIEIRGKRSE